MVMTMSVDHWNKNAATRRSYLLETVSQENLIEMPECLQSLGQHVQDILKYSPRKHCCWWLCWWGTNQVWRFANRSCPLFRKQFSSKSLILSPRCKRGSSVSFRKVIRKSSVNGCSRSRRFRVDLFRGARQGWWWKVLPSLWCWLWRCICSCFLDIKLSFVTCFYSWAEDDLWANGLYYCFPQL